MRWVIALVALFVGSHSQTTIFPVLQDPPVISNCSSNITRYVYNNEGAIVEWQEPTASGADGRELGPPIRMPQNAMPGTFFYVGSPITVTYTFTDEFFNTAATCEFTISIESATCNQDEFQCNHNGRCIPLDNICNRFQDCADDSDESECPNDDGCGELLMFESQIRENCFSPIEVLSTMQLEGGVLVEPSVWMMSVPSNQSHYLIGVDLQFGLFLELGMLGFDFPAPSFKAELATTSGQMISVTVDVYQSDAVARLPIITTLDPNEEVELILEYTPDLHNEPYQPIALAEQCPECVRFLVLSNRYPDCSGDDFLNCMKWFYLWDEAEIANSGGCGLPVDNDVLFRSLFTPCLQTVNIDPRGPLTILGCPDVIQAVAPPLAPVQVFWKEPIAFNMSGYNAEAQLVSEYYSGSEFFVGDSILTYDFYLNLFGEEVLPPQCAFSVSVEQVSCGGSEFLCNTGECISLEYVCDSHPDCSNGSDVDAWNQGHEQCLSTGNDCQDVLYRHSNVNNSCFGEIGTYPNFPETIQNEPTNGIPWNFTVYSFTPESVPIYLMRITLKVNKLATAFSLNQGDSVPAFYINIKSSKSLHDINLSLAFPFPIGGEGAGVDPDHTRQIALRVPPLIQDLEDILVFVTYTSDFLNSAAPIPLTFTSACFDCVEAKLNIPIADDCESYLQDSYFTSCLADYYQWNEVELQMPQCEIQENADEFRNVFGECLDIIDISLQDSIFVVGCPKDFSKIVAPLGGPVSWTEPQFIPATDSEFFGSTSASSYPGDFFEVGVTEVRHTTVGFPNASAECVFTVTTAAATCEENQFMCSNGHCIATEFVCDFFNDCGDSSDELGDACSDKVTQCADILVPRHEALSQCAEPQPPQLISDHGFYEEEGFVIDESFPLDVWKFTVPLNRDDLYLTGIDFGEHDFELLGSEYYSALSRGVYAFYIEVSTTKSNQYATAFKVAPDLRKKRAVAPGLDETSGQFRIPLKLRRGEEVHARLLFTADHLNEDPEPILRTACEYNCVNAQVLAFRPDCAGGFSSPCLDRLVQWKEALQEKPEDVVNQCTNQEADDLFVGLYDECFNPPEFAFVESDQTAYVGDMVNLRCITLGNPPPNVTWVRASDGVILANGTRQLGVSVSVAEADEKYKCEIANLLGASSEEVTVGPYSAQCQDNIQSRLNLFNRSDTCSSESVINGFHLPLASSTRIDFNFYIGGVNSNGYVHTVSLSGDSFRAFNAQEFFPIQTVDLFIRRGPLPARRRRKREVEPILYARRYNHVLFMLASGNIEFRLDPPVSLLSVIDSFDVRIVFIGGQLPPLGDGFNVPSFAKYVACPQTSATAAPELPARKRRQVTPIPRGNCTDLYRHLSILERQAKGDTCGIDDRRYQMLQLCLGEADAEPVVQVHPSSHQATLGQNARLNCYIENAVSYEWRKVSSDAQPTTLEYLNSNTLLFSNFDATDQGMYRCLGYGGGEYQGQLVRSRPAVLTAPGVSTFLVTVRFPYPVVDIADLEEGNLERDPSYWFDVYLREVFQTSGDASLSEIEIRGFKEGSIILEALLHYVGSNNDTELALEIQDFMQQQLEVAYPSNPPEYFNSFYGIGAADVTSMTVQSIGSCPEDVTQEPGGNILTWPETPINVQAQSLETCAAYTANAGSPRAVRLCSGDFIAAPVWEELVVNDCFEGEDANEQLDIIAETEVTMDNVREVASDVAGLTNETADITGDGLVDIAIILEGIADVGDASEEVSNSVVETVNNVLEVDEQEFVDTIDYNVSARIVRSLERQISNLQQLGKNFTDIRRNVGVRTVLLPMDTFALTNGIAFQSMMPAGNFGFLEADDTEIFYNANDVDINNAEASIALPDKAVMSESTFSANMIPVSFFIYQRTRLFQSRRLIRESMELGEDTRRIVSSRIIAATVEGANVQGLPATDPIVAAFLQVEARKTEDEVFENEECVFWDFTLRNGTGDWSNEGCERVDVPGTDRIVCHCDHLTSFAVIVDVHAQKIHSLVLDIISKIGCAVSIACLTLTIITYLVVKKLRKNQPQRILICLCFALLGLYVIFLVGIEATRSKYGCIIVAALLHYFTLASLMWMAVEAVNMYLLFVKVLNAHVHLFMVKASIVAWGAPLIVVVVSMAVDYTIYDNQDFCFMKVGYVFYFGQLLLIGLILLFNFIVFMLVMYKLTCGRRTSSHTDVDKKKEALKRLQNAICISVLLGLTWIAAFFTIIESSTFAFQVIFCIFNSLQGLFIFLLFCVRQQDVRRVWKSWFCCKKEDNYKKRSSAPTSSSANTGTGTTGTGNRAAHNSNSGYEIPMKSRGQNLT